MKQDHSEFIGWLIKRLIYKHLYSQDDIVIHRLRQLQEDLNKNYTCDLDDESLNLIISNYYIDFNLDKSEDFSVGFSEDERQKLRTTIRSIINDAVNKRTDIKTLIK